MKNCRPTGLALLCCLFFAYGFAHNAPFPNVGNDKLRCCQPDDTTFIRYGICPNDTVHINGTAYTQSKPYGVEVIVHGKTDGSDSIIVVDLKLLSPGEYFFTHVYCNNQSVLINDHLYDELTPDGTDTIPGGAANGCDSIIHVHLIFAKAPVVDLQQNLCAGDTLWVGTTPYHEHYYLGTTVFPGGSYLGCDSTVNVNLTILPRPTDTVFLSICRDTSLIINGSMYGADRLEGEELLPGAATDGCDSLLVIRLHLNEQYADFLGPDRSLGLGDSYCVHTSLPFTPTEIHWSPQPPCLTPNCLDFCTIATASTTYLLQTITPDGCRIIDTLNLKVGLNRHVYVANVFKPGAAQPNDRFFVQTDNSVQSIHWLRIFNRWGELLYFEENPTQIPYSIGWDGKRNGRYVAPGVYAYAMEIEYVDGKIEIKKGDVTILR